MRSAEEFSQMSIGEVIDYFKRDCPCGRKHGTEVRDVRIGPGLVRQTGRILRENGFSEELLLVADQNTLKAAEGIEESLQGFHVTLQLYGNLRVATMEEVREIEEKIAGKEISVLAVGTGSLHDPCRLATARQNKKLCLFATAPSMDGFASYSSPIVADGFKASYAAKSPEVIIGDTEILARAPKALKSAGFGDMMAKYTALIDWQIAALLTGEYYCGQIAALTRGATDGLAGMADLVTAEDAPTAGKIFEALLKTGIGMSFTQNSRPASGAEHIVSHLIECVQLRDGIVPNYHGEDIGVCTLETLKFYDELAEHRTVGTKRETVDWEDVYGFYGSMAGEVRKLNTPDTVADAVDPAVLKEKWPEIRAIIRSVPSYAECRDLMKRAGCRLTVREIGKEERLFRDCFRYSPYMRRRITLLRLRDMITV